MAAETVRIEIPIETLDKTEPGISNVTRKFEKMGKAADTASNSASKASQTVSKFDKSAQQTEKTLSKWAKEKYQVAIEAKERVTPVLKTLGSGLRSFASRTWSVTMRAVDLVTAPIKGIFRLLANPIFQVGTVLGVSIGLADTINTYKDFEAAMSQVSAISGATGSELDKLTEKAKEMGATTKFTAKETADAFNYMAMAGWKTNDMLSGIEGILNLAAASGEDIGTTSDIVTDALTAFKMNASDAGHFSDVLAAAASNANTNVSMMGETFKYAGAMAGTLGYSIEDVALMTGLMANSGIKATMSGTALNMMFTRLSTNSGNARDQLSELGINFFDASGNARDLSDVMSELRKATEGMNDEQKANIANTIAGTQAQKGLLAILNASEKDYYSLSEAINNADGAAQKMADTMMDNLQGSITLFQSALDGVKISFGSRLSPYVRSLADWLTAQMPALETALDDMMDWVDMKVEAGKKKLAQITATVEWKNADIFGRGKILWNEFILEPFTKWWDSEGHRKVAEIADNIGKGLGTALNVGLMTLLGFDISKTADAGANVGASFARGFAEGFDFKAVSAKLMEGIGNMIKSAGKLLPGGEQADLGSLISLIILSKLAIPFMSLGKGVFSLGKSIFGGSEALGGASVMSTLLGSANTGKGLLGLGAMTAIKLGAGNLPGNASLSAGALSGLGLASIAGGIMGGISVTSGAIDAYKASKTDNETERGVLETSSASKIGGAAAGAAIGTIIFPGVGTLIGAGIGGLVGTLSGDTLQKKYGEDVDEEKRRAFNEEKVRSVTGLDKENVIFTTKALRDAMNDSEVSAEKFARLLQEDVRNKAAEVFGDIILSAKEIKDVSSRITFGEMTEGLTKFNETASTTERSLSDLQSVTSSLQKANWKVNLGVKLTEDEMESYKSSIESFVSAAQQYITDNHYEATVALRILTGEDANVTGLDTMYQGFKDRVGELKERLGAVVEEALQDGVISTEPVTLPDGTIQLSESGEIASLQQQISDITNKLAEAQTEAEFEALAVKFSGAALDKDSFAQLQTSLAEQVQTATNTYDNALVVTLTNLKLRLAEGMSQEEYDAEVQAATEGYRAQIEEIKQRVLDFNLESITEAWGQKVGLAFSKDELKAGIEKGLSEQSDVSMWDQEDVKRWLGLENVLMDESTFEGFYESVKTAAAAVPKEMKQEIIENMATVIPTFEEVMKDRGPISTDFYNSYIAELKSGAAEADFSPASDEVSKGLAEEFSNSGLYAGASSAMNTALKKALESTQVKANVPVKLTFDYSVTNPNIPSWMIPSGGGKASVGGKAAGGYVYGGPQLSWLAEEGYGEYIIPTNPSRRGAALELFAQAGESLGVFAHAAGGFVGASNPSGNALGNIFSTGAFRNEASDYTGKTEGEYSPSVPVAAKSGTVSTSAGPLEVSVAVNPEFVINSDNTQSEEDIVQTIRRHMREIADELGGNIAEKLGAVYSNMPLYGEA